MPRIYADDADQKRSLLIRVIRVNPRQNFFTLRPIYRFAKYPAFFVNVVFPSAGTYWVQTLADTVVLEEFPLIVTDSGAIAAGQPAEEISETIN